MSRERGTLCSSPLFRGTCNRVRSTVRHHHLNRVVDTLPRIAQRGRKIGERECVGVDLCRVEALLGHQFQGAMGGAAALATNAEDINVVSHEMRDVGRDGLMWKSRKADSSSVKNADFRLERRDALGGAC